MRVALPVAAIFSLACGTSGTSPGGPDAESPKEAEAATPSPCAELDPSGSLTTFDGQPCGWALRPTSDAGVELVHSTLSPTSRAGETPPPCGLLPCTYRGVETPAGPLVVVEVADAHSEAPSGVWLGVVQGDRLAFVDLWEDAGDAVVDAGITIGPAHALAPFDCEGTIALFAEARLPGASRVPAPASLLTREGAVADEATTVQRARCEPLRIGLP